MKKSRTIQIISGDTDMRYANLYGLYNLSLPIVKAPWETEEKLSQLYLEGMFHALYVAPVYITPPAYVGNELFCSTSYRKPRFNNVVHTRSSLLSMPVTYNIRRSLSNIYGDYAKFIRPLYWPVDGMTGINPSDDYTQYEDAARRAWWTMQPRFEGEVSMLNFLAELRDFKTLAKAMWTFDLMNLIQRIQRMWLSLRRDTKRFVRNASIKDVAELPFKKSWSLSGTAAELRLLKEFAVDPLLADLLSIHQQMITLINEVQQDFFEAGQFAQTRHYSEEYVLQDTLVNETGGNFPFAKGRFKSTVFTATMEYRYHYDMRTTADAFKRYWGLVPNLEVFWNGTPFTFLIDYFFKIGKAIHTMSVDPRVSLQKVQYCESFLTEHVNARCTSGASENPPYPGQKYRLAVNGKYTKGRRGVAICGYKGSTYVRNVKEPNKGAALPRVVLPSNGQVLNALALARCFL